MIKTGELISEAISLPADIRALIVNKLLESLNPTSKEIDKIWARKQKKGLKILGQAKLNQFPEA